jgi:2-polyprenyl-3-methyl-5-hydroxy-6-metoxy-1,4-benzoquinol methylase
MERHPVRRHSESYLPPAAHLEIARAVAGRVRPDFPELQSWYQIYAHAHAARIAHDLAHIERFAAPDARIADVGAAPYLLTAALQARGYRVEGLDLQPDRFASSIAALGLTIRRCNVETDRLPYDAGTIDVVVVNEIFEHLRIDPIATFAELHRILKPAGLLIMSTPNGLSLKRVAASCLHGRPGPEIYEEFAKLTQLGHMGHVREYAVNEVLNFLQSASFQPFAVIHRGRYAHSGRSLLSLAADALGRVLPRTRPFFTVVARRSEATADSSD